MKRVAKNFSSFFMNDYRYLFYFFSSKHNEMDQKY